MMKKLLFTLGILAAAGAAIAAIGSNVGVSYNADGGEGTVVQHSALTQWVTVCDAGGPDNADASPLVNPDTEIDDSTDHILDLGTRGGTGVVVRFAYRGAVSTSPVIKVFGRTSTSEDWMVLRNRAGDTTATLTVDTTNDSTDGTDKFTSVDLDDHYFDACGCRYILVGIQTAQSGGTASVSYIQVKSF